MDYQLLVVRGRSALEALSLLDGVTTVGRHDTCHIRIKSSQVSRKHCELFERKGLLMVKDLGSANGTLVNGKKVEGQRVLEPGDELTLGPISFRVAKVGQAPPVRNQTPQKTSADTAVVEAVAAPVSDDEFEIDFDDEPTVATGQPAPPKMDDSFEIPFDEEPFPAQPAATPQPVSAQETKKEPRVDTKKAAEPEPAGADQAIADFLLDIKIDEDE
jgi:predicted component of type VI protein secretion system